MPALTPQSITMQNGRLSTPACPVLPFIEGDGTGPDIWRASVVVFDAAVAKAYGGKRKIEWKEVLAGEKAFNQTGNWLPGGNARRVPHVPGGHQGPADHARRRRHSLAQRCPAADSRPLRLPAAGAVLHGRALAGEATRADRHGHLPREHRGHLRGHRIRRRHARSRRRCSTSSRRSFPKSSARCASAPRTKIDAWGKQLEGIGAPHRDLPVQVGIGFKPISYLAPSGSCTARSATR